MALILAIEPDRRQANHLQAMVRGRLRAEFILGDSAERALAELGDRVPDLVLTTALLSPKDENELTDRLRALDGKAAHVQTLTIPMLASPAHARRTSKVGGVLSALLGDRSDDDPLDGCDPAMFAEQCKDYLERAARERAQFEESKREMEAERVAPAATGSFEVAVAEPSARWNERDVESMAKETVIPAATNVVPADEPPVPDLLIAPPAPAVPRSMPTSRRKVRALLNADNEEAARSLMQAVAALSDERESLICAVEPAVQPAEVEPVMQPAEVKPALLPAEDSEGDPGTRTSETAYEVDISGLMEVGLGQASSTTNDEPPVPVYEIDTALLTREDEESLAFEAVLGLDTQLKSDNRLTDDSDGEAYTPLTQPEARTWPILEGIILDAGVSDSSSTPVAAAPQRTEADELREWQEIIEALRREAQSVPSSLEAPPQAESIAVATAAGPELPDPDAAASEPMTSDHVMSQPAAPVAAQPGTPASADERVAAGQATPPRKLRRRSVEDEWGFFDPDRAGFAALLAKLEEITEEDARKTQRR